MDLYQHVYSHILSSSLQVIQCEYLAEQSTDLRVKVFSSLLKDFNVEEIDTQNKKFVIFGAYFLIKRIENEFNDHHLKIVFEFISNFQEFLTSFFSQDNLTQDQSTHQLFQGINMDRLENIQAFIRYFDDKLEYHQNNLIDIFQDILFNHSFLLDNCENFQNTLQFTLHKEVNYKQGLEIRSRSPIQFIGKNNFKCILISQNFKDTNLQMTVQLKFQQDFVKQFQNFETYLSDIDCLIFQFILPLELKLYLQERFLVIEAVGQALLALIQRIQDKSIVQDLNQIKLQDLKLFTQYLKIEQRQNCQFSDEYTIIINNESGNKQVYYTIGLKEENQSHSIKEKIKELWKQLFRIIQGDKFQIDSLNLDMGTFTLILQLKQKYQTISEHKSLFLKFIEILKDFVFELISIKYDLNKWDLIDHFQNQDILTIFHSPDFSYTSDQNLNLINLEHSFYFNIKYQKILRYQLDFTKKSFLKQIQFTNIEQRKQGFQTLLMIVKGFIKIDFTSITLKTEKK